MRILKESYTKEEIKQRIVDTRNIISALQDSLSILQSSLSDPDDTLDREECSKLARYARGYEIDADDMMQNFYDDFETFLSESEEEFEEEEVVEENLEESSESLSESANNGSVEDFLKKMEGKSKAEAEKIVRQAKGNPNADEAYRQYLELTEDTEKVKDGKWVNKGDTGETHGTFATKKEADAQRKAMFANGFKG